MQSIINLTTGFTRSLSNTIDYFASENDADESDLTEISTDVEQQQEISETDSPVPIGNFSSLRRRKKRVGFSIADKAPPEKNLKHTKPHNRDEDDDDISYEDNDDDSTNDDDENDDNDDDDEEDDEERKEYNQERNTIHAQICRGDLTLDRIYAKIRGDILDFFLNQKNMGNSPGLSNVTGIVDKAINLYQLTRLQQFNVDGEFVMAKGTKLLQFNVESILEKNKNAIFGDMCNNPSFANGEVCITDMYDFVLSFNLDNILETQLTTKMIATNWITLCPDVETTKQTSNTNNMEINKRTKFRMMNIVAQHVPKEFLICRHRTRAKWIEDNVKFARASGAYHWAFIETRNVEFQVMLAEMRSMQSKQDSGLSAAMRHFLQNADVNEYSIIKCHNDVMLEFVELMESKMLFVGGKTKHLGENYQYDQKDYEELYTTKVPRPSGFLLLKNFDEDELILSADSTSLSYSIHYKSSVLLLL